MASADNSSALCEHIAALARASLIAEARLTPKPGLVDAVTNGAHTDMDLSTFMASAAALEPLFYSYVAVGIEIGSADPGSLADAVRKIGVRAETVMFAATEGVNTHKGANFTFALILGATGAMAARGRTLPFGPEDTDAVFQLVARMGESLLDHDVRELRERVQGGAAELSHGERLLLERGMKGVRGEAAQGYPLLRSIALPYLHGIAPQIQDVASTRIALLRCLVKIMSVLEDTNVVHRGGPQALIDHQARCRAIDGAHLPAHELIEALAAYDAELTLKNVSPGGAADLLSLAVFFGLIEGLLTPQLLAY